MCIIPIVFMIVALILYKKKCTLSETRLAEMVKETEARKLALAGATENTDEPVAFEERCGRIRPCKRYRLSPVGNRRKRQRRRFR